MKILAEVREKTGLPVVTEIWIRDIDVILKYADVIQIGAET
jgi:3-deoxy-D-arabino-heptulosonate 7-phosphate (DAHP) synthase